MICQTIAAYFEDDCADELTVDPVFTAILEKEVLASQPTISRFFNRMDELTLEQFGMIERKMRDIVYAIKMPQHMVFDLASTLLNTYSEQEGEAFNYHYQAHGYHLLLCFDGISGDLLKAQLRDGTHYCSKDADQFMIPLLQEYQTKYPSLPLYLRSDSGFASPDLCQASEDNDCKYAIRLKITKTLLALAKDKADDLRRATKDNMVDYAVTYGEFEYQAGSWPRPRRVVFKIEKPAGQSVFMYTFVVTPIESAPYQIILFYCGRGKMENFIKEGKEGFAFSAVSGRTKIVNANRFQLHVLVDNPFNWLRRLVLAAKMRKLQIDTVRRKLLKIAARGGCKFFCVYGGKILPV